MEKTNNYHNEAWLFALEAKGRGAFDKDNQVEYDLWCKDLLEIKQELRNRLNKDDTNWILTDLRYLGATNIL